MGKLIRKLNECHFDGLALPYKIGADSHYLSLKFPGTFDEFLLHSICCLSITSRCSAETAKLEKSCRQRHTIAKRLHSFLIPKILAKFGWKHPQLG